MAVTSWTSEGMIWSEASLSSFDYIPRPYFEALTRATNERLQALTDIDALGAGSARSIPVDNQYLSSFDFVSWLLDEVVQDDRPAFVRHTAGTINHTSAPADGGTAVTQWTESTILAHVGLSRVDMTTDSVPSWKWIWLAYNLLNSVKWFFRSVSIAASHRKFGSISLTNESDYATAIQDIEDAYDAATESTLNQDWIKQTASVRNYGAGPYYDGALTTDRGTVDGWANSTDYSRTVDRYIVAHTPPAGSFDNVAFNAQSTSYQQNKLNYLDTNTVISSASNADYDIVSSAPRPPNFPSAPPAGENHQIGWIAYDRNASINPFNPDDLQGAYEVHKYDVSGGFQFI